MLTNVIYYVKSFYKSVRAIKPTMCIHLKFDYKKTTQALNYFAQKEGGQINRMKAIKLVFFADRYHLRKFGRPITNDEYYAMKHGPVGSGVKDIASFVTDNPDELEYSRTYIDRVGEYEYRSITELDRSVFSRSDLEALEFAYNTFGSFHHYRLANDITHEYPEWKKHEEAIKNGASRITMDYVDFLEDSSSELNPCFKLEDKDKEIVKEQLKELSAIYAF